MSTLVADVELSAPLARVDLPAHASGLLALVRWRSRPVGCVRLRARGSVSPATMQAAVAAQVGSSFAHAEARAPVVKGPVSIVVCTRERPEELRRCLAALRAQAAAGHEVIVVDNAGTCGRAQKLVAAHPYRYLSEPRPGLDHARNRGWREARGEVVAFTDDDCVPDRHWIDALAAPYADETVGASTGLVMPLELETPAQERFEAYCAGRRSFRPRRYRAPLTPPSAAGVAGMGANMSFRRRLLEELGGFDPRFDGGMPTLSGGDTEIFARVLARGGAIAYRPDALVWHRHRREMPELRRVVFGYGVGLHAMLAKRLLEDRDRRAPITAARWLLGPPLKAAWNALRGRPATSPDLLLLELWGALHGPFRYRAACSASGAS